METLHTRRMLAQSLSLAALGCALIGCATSGSAPLASGKGLAWEAAGTERLNVLLIISDDLTTALSGYGHPQCKTPNLDRLAERGVVFTRAYCQYPVCGPARASILTGHYPTAIGETTGQYEAAPSDNVPPTGGFREKIPDIVTMPQHFANNGYTTVRISKMYHMGVPGEIISGSSRYEDPASWHQAYNMRTPEQYVIGETENLSPLVTHPGMDFITVKGRDGAEVHADFMAAQLAIEKLQELPLPYFMGVGMVRPHVPLVAPKEYFDMYPWEEMELPFVPDGDLDDVPEAAQTQTNAVKYGMNEEQMRKALAGYYASITFMDAQVGSILDEVERLGMNENTVIIFTSDHGYNLGEHTAWQKLSLWEGTTRVPLIIATPWTAGGRSNEIVELIDLFPTLADVAGISVPTELPGESLRPMLENPSTARTTNPVAYTITRLNAESIRTERWRYSLWNDGVDGVELYDHDNDPGEHVNLAVRPGNEAVMTEMHEVIMRTRHRARPIYE